MSAETFDEKPAATAQVQHRWWLFTACVLVSLTNELSTAITNPSLGPKRRDLGASSAVMQDRSRLPPCIAPPGNIGSPVLSSLVHHAVDLLIKSRQTAAVLSG